MCNCNCNLSTNFRNTCWIKNEDYKNCPMLYRSTLSRIFEDYQLNNKVHAKGIDSIKEYIMDTCNFNHQDWSSLKELYNSSNTALFSLVSGITSQQLSVPPINSISINTTSTRFFAQKINVNPIIIKEVDEKSYISVRGNPLYKTTFIGTYNNINQTTDQAETQMPGLKTFLSV